MSISKNVKDKIWIQLSKALIAFYCAAIKHRNGHILDETTELNLEYAFCPNGMELTSIHVSKQGKKQLYKSIKADLLKKDQGYRYIAKTSPILKNQGVHVQYGPRKQDTLKFWDEMDQHILNFIEYSKNRKSR